MTQAIEIKWKVGTAKGYTDVLRLDEFARDNKGAERVHIVRGPKQGIHHARYRLNVSGVRAQMDYSAFPEFNDRNGMLTGLMVIEFAGPARRQVKSVTWDGGALGASEVEIKILAINGPTSSGETVARQQEARARETLRPGQVAFRRSLDMTYGSSCCISGCPVPWALEAAHIVTYANRDSNRPSNGLLLRSDLHALFDSNQLAIEPVSRVVHFSPEAQSWPEYAGLHRTAKLKKPQPGYEEDAPENTALKSRWDHFLKENTRGAASVSGRGRKKRRAGADSIEA